MRIPIVLLALVLGGCAATQPAAFNATASFDLLSTYDTPRTKCYLHQGETDTTIEGARLVQIHGLWTLTGDVAGPRSARDPQRRVRVEAVNQDEWIVLATLSREITEGDGRWSFQLPIPNPTTFDHLHVGVVSAQEALYKLPAH